MNLKEINKAAETISKLNAEIEQKQRVLKNLKFADVSNIQVTVNNKNGGCLNFFLSPAVDTEITEDITGLFYEEAAGSIADKKMLIQNILLSMPQFLICSDDDPIPF